MAKSRDFNEEFDADMGDVEMSDDDLEALMNGHTSPLDQPSTSTGPSMEPGGRVKGLVIDFRGGEILVELDSKTIGAIEEDEFVGSDLPEVGDTIHASFTRFDVERDVAVLSVKDTIREVFWDDLTVGTILEGQVLETNKGGLVLGIKGERAFMPMSQIANERVEDVSHFVGQKLHCEVTSFNRDDQNIVVSRRRILEREAEEVRGQALSRLSEGEILPGTVVKIVEHLGAFIDLGGVQGLLHESKIRQHHHDLGADKKLHVGQQVQVEIASIDAERERISLDFKRLAADTWNQSVEGYEVGDELAGWVTKVGHNGVSISLDEGVEGLVPREILALSNVELSRGSIVRVRITAIDVDKKTIELKLLDETE